MVLGNVNSTHQLDFLGGYIGRPLIKVQPEFWNADLSERAIKPIREPVYSTVEQGFVNIDPSLARDYIGYWNFIKPQGESEIFQRYLFAFMSVHTSWEANVTGYKAIRDWWNWMNRADELQSRIEDARVGMQNNRVRYITTFAAKFWENPKFYCRGDSEPWTNYRDRLERNILGLGMAKTSFAIEMIYPTTADVTCLDTHGFQAYGLDQTKDSRRYRELELHWVEMSKMWNVPPYVARCMFWDVKQGHNTSKYWSHVFHKDKD